jgi:hypothetical protein
MKVWICIYTHKHGTDASAYLSLKGAEEAAFALMYERADESWERLDWALFQAAGNFREQDALFHKIEQDVNNGETIEIMERDAL